MNEKAGKKYGLIIKKKPSAFQQKQSVFNEDDSDSEMQSEQKNVNHSIRAEAARKKQIRQTEVEMEKVLAEDPTAYDYDAVYDKMAERKANMLIAKNAKNDKKPKYITNLLKFAETRKKEEERRIERQVQKEREAEGSEFADKDAFVTSAYRQKMQEMMEAEERQRRQDELDGDVTKQTDLSKFYRNLLEKNVSTGGSYNTEQRTETTEDRENEKREQSGYLESTDSNSERSIQDRETSNAERMRDKEPFEKDEYKKDRRVSEERLHETHECRENEKESKKRERDESVNRAKEQHETEVIFSDKDCNSKNPEVSGSKDDTKLKTKFVKHSSNATVMSARERYLARKKSRIVKIANSDDED